MEKLITRFASRLFHPEPEQAKWGFGHEPELDCQVNKQTADTRITYLVVMLKLLFNFNFGTPEGNYPVSKKGICLNTKFCLIAFFVTSYL